jgi:hypothetical protein
MPTIPVVARRAFTYGRRDVQPGDRVEVSPVDAVVLVTAGKAIFATPAPRRPPDPVAPRAAKRIYKRRDLRAES